MPRPRKYDGLHDRQAAYHHTEKGKAAVKKYESSEGAKARKRHWWQENKASKPVDRRQQFIDTHGEILEALAPLDKRESCVISLYFGLDDGKPLTLEEIGTQIGISKQRAGQIKSSALKKMSAKQETAPEQPA